MSELYNEFFQPLLPEIQMPEVYNTPNLEYEYEDAEVAALLDLEVTILDDESILAFSVLSNQKDVISHQLKEYKDQYLQGVINAEIIAQNRTLLLPVNLGNNCFVGLVIHLDEVGDLKYVEYLDAMHHLTNGFIDRKVKNELYAVFRVDCVKSHPLLLESGVTSSGALTVQNLILATNPVYHRDTREPRVFSPEETKALRSKHLKYLDSFNSELNFAYRQHFNIHTFKVGESYLETKRITDPWSKDVGTINLMIDALDDCIAKLNDGDGNPKIEIQHFLQKFKSLLSDVSWDTRNNRQFSQFPWFILSTALEDTGIRFSDLTKEMYKHLNAQGGLPTLRVALESIINSEVAYEDPFILRRVLGYQCNEKIFEQLKSNWDVLWDNLWEENQAEFLEPTLNETSLETLLAILRMLQISGEHVKSLSWFDTTEDTRLPRRLFQDCRDNLSHINLEHLPRLLNVLKRNPFSINALLTDIGDLTNRMAAQKKAHDALMPDGNIFEQYEAVINVADPDRQIGMDDETSFPAIRGLVDNICGDIFQKPSFSLRESDKGVKLTNKCNKTIDDILEILFPFPSHSTISKKTLEDIQYLSRFIQNVPIDYQAFEIGVKKCTENVNTKLLLLIHGQISKVKSANSAMNKAVSDMMKKHKKAKNLKAIFNYMRNTEILTEIDYTNFLFQFGIPEVDAQATFEVVQNARNMKRVKPLNYALSILGVNQKKYNAAKGTMKAVEKVVAQRNDLKVAFKKIAKLGVRYKNSPEMHECLYNRFLSNMEKVSGLEFKDVGYFDDSILSELFRKVTGLEDADLLQKSNLRLQRIDCLLEMISMLRELLDIKETAFQHLISNKDYGDDMKEIKGQMWLIERISKEPQSNTPYFIRKIVEEKFRKQPQLRLAAEFILSVVSEIVINELVEYPEIDSFIIKPYKESRNHFCHEDPTGNRTLFVPFSTTYLDHISSTANQSVITAMNLHFILQKARGEILFKLHGRSHDFLIDDDKENKNTHTHGHRRTSSASF